LAIALNQLVVLDRKGHRKTHEKMKLNDSEKTQLRNLFESNGLSKDDIFVAKHFTIVKRSGIQKIQATQNIHIEFEVVQCDRDFVVRVAPRVVFGLLNNLQTYTIFLLFETVNTSSTALAGLCGMFRHEKTHTVGDVGLVVL
jgi:hypothetical protein